MPVWSIFPLQHAIFCKLFAGQQHQQVHQFSSHFLILVVRPCCLFLFIVTSHLTFWNFRSKNLSFHLALFSGGNCSSHLISLGHRHVRQTILYEVCYFGHPQSLAASLLSPPISTHLLFNWRLTVS